MRTETTGLISGNTSPKYAFESSVNRRRKQVRQFQCCICTIIGFIIITIVVVLTSYSMKQLPNNSSAINEDSTTTNLYTLPGILYIDDAKTEYQDPYIFQKSMDAVKNDMCARIELDKMTPKLDTNSPSFKHQMVTATSSKGLLLSQYAQVEEFATRKYFGQTNAQLPTICINLTIPGNTCQIFPNITCNFQRKYRSFDGSCNNILKPTTYGVAYTPFRRILQPDYADGISQPRVSRDKSPLPSARTISLTVHRPYFRDDPKFTVMLAVWGQFLDHDVTATALSRLEDGSSISCCRDASVEHPECFPVLLSPNDNYGYNTTCMEFVRSAPAPTCCMGPRQQLNQVSAFIDGSVIYGSDTNVATNLRFLKNGFLKMYVTPDNKTLLPISNDLNDGCNREEQNKRGRYCFMTGDARANENLHLTSMHLIWARHHNNLASNLSKLNPHWNDERIYQESRRILIAQMQHITYNEFLHIVIGDNLMEKYDLRPQKTGYYDGYDDQLDASIANNFASATFRFAHSLIPTLYQFIGNDSSDYMKLHEILFDPFLLYEPGGLDKVLRGAVRTKIQANDPFFSPELKQHLFEREDANSNRTKFCGLDLVSLNIQRGRDHGLPGYVRWRELCGLKKSSTFDDLAGDIDIESLNYIRSVYRSVEDVDLYTGLLSEKPIGGSLLGPTLNCLILDQFIRLKKGDRFWYENSKHMHGFSIKQLNEIRKTTLAGVLCENSDTVEYIQRRAMERMWKGNDKESCVRLKEINLQPWKEGYVSIGSGDMAVRRHVAGTHDIVDVGMVSKHQKRLLGKTRIWST